MYRYFSFTQNTKHFKILPETLNTLPVLHRIDLVLDSDLLSQKEKKNHRLATSKLLFLIGFRRLDILNVVRELSNLMLRR